MTPTLRVHAEQWPVVGGYATSRGPRTATHVVVAEIREGDIVGRGECLPYARYGESVAGVLAAIEALAGEIAAGAGRAELQRLLPAGAARNALDCAFWDLDAKRAGKRVWELAGLSEPGPLTTAYTIGLAAPEAMAEAARRAAHRPLIKVKLGGDGDEARLAAIRAAAPEARLIVDANEAWRKDRLAPLMGACARAGVEMIEQPLAAADDGALAEIQRVVPVYADESVHTRADLARVAGRYDGINIKLDKTGGLTEALALAAAAEAASLPFMVGCMVGTSLAMAPATLVAQRARIVDLDGPLLLARDRPPGLRYEDSLVHPPEASLWG
ncbi:MAG: dipeptide epimerase [Hyphomicrobiales bacterium]|nr:dipeptide epimerase [Hyphomicrobiales bacterium]